jgi:hypothetical protein
MKLKKGDKVTYLGAAYVVDEVSPLKGGVTIIEAEDPKFPWSFKTKIFLTNKGVEDALRNGSLKTDALGSNNCWHTWALYKGTVDWYHYCQLCNEKKMIPWTERGEGTPK